MVLVVLCLLAIAFRVTLNLADSGVIDVGYAGVVGADRITQGEAIYGDGVFPEDVGSGDTYGPANYAAYVPFELALPWSGEWDDLPAAHAAALFFDAATLLGLFVLGLRAGGGGRPGRGLGVVLAFAWLTYPYTAFALQSNSNDSLVAALLVWGLVVLGSPVGRGVLVGLAAMVKFAPLALVPLYVTGRRGLAGRFEGRRPWRAALVAGAARCVRDRADARPPGDRPGPRDLLRADGREPARPREPVLDLGSGRRARARCSCWCSSRRQCSACSSPSARASGPWRRSRRWARR